MYEPENDFEVMAAEAGRIATEHGFWTPERSSLYEKIALAHSELSEALEELRAGHDPAEVYFRADGKPEGFGVELADTVIRIADMAYHNNIPLWDLIIMKQGFNAGRPFMHGKQA